MPISVVMEVVCWLRATLALLPLLFAPAATNIDPSSSSSSSETGDLASLLTASLGHWPAGPAHLLLLGGAGRDDEAASRCQDLIRSGGGGDSLWRVVKAASTASFEQVEEVLMGSGAAPDGVTVVVLEDGEEEHEVKSPFRQAVKDGLMERGTWLLPEGAFRPEDIKSRFDSHIFIYNFTGGGSADLVETFSVKQKRGMVNYYGRWTGEEEGSGGGSLDVPTPHIWERRQRFLEGVLLRGTHMHWPPFTYVEKAEDGTEKTYGILPEALKAFQDVAKFELEEYQPPDRNWGAPLNFSDIGGDWNGMIQEVKSGRADFCHAALSTTTERAQVITYGLSFYKDAFTFSINEPSGAAINFWVFVDIFATQVWVATVACILVGTGVHFVASRKVEGGGGLSRNRPPVDGRGLINALGAVSTVYLQRDTIAARYSQSSRLAHLVNCLAGFVLFAFYTGVLTSLMTATPAGVDIHSFQDILDKDYQPMVLGESADSLTMQNSPPGTVLHRIYYELLAGKPEYHVNSQQEMASTLRTDPKLALFALKSATFGEKGILRLNLKEAIVDMLSIALPKDSELLGAFNHHFFKMEEAGVMSQLRKKYFESLSDSSSSDPTAEAFVLGYDNLFFPVLVMAWGTAAAAAIFVLENAGVWFSKRVNGEEGETDKFRRMRTNRKRKASAAASAALRSVRRREVTLDYSPHGHNENFFY